MQPNAPIAPTAVRYKMTALLLAAMAYGLPASAQEAQPVPPRVVHAENQKSVFPGIIVDRHGDTMRVREGNVATHTVVITDETRIGTPSGLFKMERKRRDQSTLMPGLLMKVEGHGGDNGVLIADKLTFSTRSLNTAQQINVGGEVVRADVSANADSIAALRKRLIDSIAHANARITNLDNYTEKVSLFVTFPTNVFELSGAMKGVLDDMVNRINGWTGYVIEVTGFADTTGTTNYNLQLSQRRAAAVVRYLVEDKGIPLRRIINPTGMGETKSFAPPNALNRRASVRVLVNKGNGNR
jgi:OOP family OmpA-OmpF porin